MGKIITLVMLLGFFGSMVYGWVMNIIHLVNMEVWIWSAKTIIGIGGVFIAPIGSIMGLFIW